MAYENCLPGFRYNFVLVNRYKDGSDKMGEHKDDEAELDPLVPIASLSLGQERDFVLKHQDFRAGTNKSIAPHRMPLANGTLLLMNPPTNRLWFHGLPPRSPKACPGVRVNLTFRKIVMAPKPVT